MTGEEMRSFWDGAAQDNPLWYVHSGLEYDAPDEKEFWASGERDVAAVLDAAGIDGGELAIDIGVGAGRLTRALAVHFSRVAAFDVSREMVSVARANLAAPNVDIAVVPGDGTLPLDDGVADLVLSLQVFQHIPSRAVTERYIAEAGRVLRPGGRFVFQLRSVLRADPVTGPAELAARVVVERLRRIRRRPPATLDSPAWRGTRVGRWQIRRAARAGGMRIERTRWISRQGASLAVVCAKDRGGPER